MKNFLTKETQGKKTDKGLKCTKVYVMQLRYDKVQHNSKITSADKANDGIRYTASIML